VPENEYQACLGADSVGRYVNRHVVGNYDEQRVS
jgi:hypothetical protein